MNFALFVLSVFLVLIPSAIIISRRGKMPATKAEKIQEKCIDKGWYAPARLLWMNNIRHLDDRNKSGKKSRDSYSCRYVYEYQDREYEKDFILHFSPDVSTTVYFKNGDPNRPFVEGVGPVGGAAAMFALAPMIAVIVVYKILEIFF